MAKKAAPKKRIIKGRDYNENKASDGARKAKSGGWRMAGTSRKPTKKEIQAHYDGASNGVYMENRIARMDKNPRAKKGERFEDGGEVNAILSENDIRGYNEEFADLLGLRLEKGITRLEAMKKTLPLLKEKLVSLSKKSESDENDDVIRSLKSAIKESERIIEKSKTKEYKKGGKIDRTKSTKKTRVNRTKKAIAQDKNIKALHGGKRISEEGNVYYEYRENRQDSNRTKKLEKGGEIKVCSVRKDIVEKGDKVPLGDGKYVSKGDFEYRWIGEDEDVFQIKNKGKWVDAESIDFEFDNKFEKGGDLKNYTSADLPKDGSEIKIHMPEMGNFPAEDIVLKYNQDNFAFDAYRNGELSATRITEKQVLDNLNNGSYEFKKGAFEDVELDRYKEFDFDSDGNLAATVNGKNYKVVYRDDKTQLYDLFEDGKVIKSNKDVRKVMKFEHGGMVGKGEKIVYYMSGNYDQKWFDDVKKYYLDRGYSKVIAEEYAKGGTINLREIEDETVLMPYVIAEPIAETAAEITLRDEFSKWKDLSDSDKKSLDKKYKTLVDKISDYLVKRANTVYTHNKSFEKDVKGKKGREVLNTFMEHWCGLVDGKLVKPISDTMARYEKESKSDSFEDGGEIYALAEKMTDSEYETKYSELTEKQKNTVKSLIRLGDEPKLALSTVLLSKEIDGNSDTWKLYTYAKGGKLGFEGLAKKVAKEYEGDKVKPEYQDEYGKRYDKEEAKEVGQKVAAKVYREQQGMMEQGGEIKSELTLSEIESKLGKTFGFWSVPYEVSVDGVSYRKMFGSNNYRKI